MDVPVIQRRPYNRNTNTKSVFEVYDKKISNKLLLFMQLRKINSLNIPNRKKAPNKGFLNSGS